MAFGMTDLEYQVGAHFKALDECVLIAALILTGYLCHLDFFQEFQTSIVGCFPFRHKIILIFFLIFSISLNGT